MSKIQQALEKLTKESREQEIFIMLGLIFSFMFFIIMIGLATGHTFSILF